MAARSVVSLNYTGLDGGTNRRHLVSMSEFTNCLFPTSKPKHKCQFLGHQKLPIFSSTLEPKNATFTKIKTAVHGRVDPVPPPAPPPDASPASWKVWILGMLISVVIPFWRNKWWPLLQLKNKVESIVETTEQVAEVVEKVAEVVEKLAEEAAVHLPEGELKQVAVFVENVAKVTEKEAHLAEDVIDKVETVEKEAESLVESVIVVKEMEAKCGGTNEEPKENATRKIDD